MISAPWRDAGLSAVAGIDARGFIFSAAVAFDLGIGLVPIRKKGKLPWHTVERSYALEYGTATLELHEDAVEPGGKVLLVDDLLATGGTAAAATELLKEIGAEVVEACFLIELEFLAGREKLAAASCPVRSLIGY
jgi:adenine phosphoribosyltransferase